jgi:type III pantothenate kinase
LFTLNKAFRMILLFDIGNTNTHIGIASDKRVMKQTEVSTRDWFSGRAGAQVRQFVGRAEPDGVVLCSVVPKATPSVKAFVNGTYELECLELNPETLRGVGINYPEPERIGPDRLANAVAAKAQFGAPSLVVDFGTAVTFDVVDKQGDYVGGIIAPGLAAMTDYLHEKTALLPRIEIREVKGAIGKSTEQAMLIGAVHGYRGLIRELISELKKELKVKRLPVVATGGYAALIAAKLPEIDAIEPHLTLEGLRLVWMEHQKTAK